MDKQQQQQQQQSRSKSWRASSKKMATRYFGDAFRSQVAHVLALDRLASTDGRIDYLGYSLCMGVVRFYEF